jgi:hypothetical protein
VPLSCFIAACAAATITAVDSFAYSDFIAACAAATGLTMCKA